jgi:hypothetical protein
MSYNSTLYKPDSYFIVCSTDTFTIDFAADK